MNLMHWRSRSNPNPTTTSPFGIFGLQQEINRMFDEMASPSLRYSADMPIVPALDIKEDDKNLTVTCDLPGVDRKDLSIAVQDNVLTLRGEKRSERNEDKDNYHCAERSFGAFERRVSLPTDVDSDHAEASIDRGVLTLRLPKVKGANPKTIPIK